MGGRDSLLNLNNEGHFLGFSFDIAEDGGNALDHVITWERWELKVDG
jgi:hypothetical protein